MMLDDAPARVVEDRGRHGSMLEWPTLRRPCLDEQLTGNDLPDAWLAAARLQMGENLATFDTAIGKLQPRERVTVLRTSSR
jgi:uncharacterized protein